MVPSVYRVHGMRRETADVFTLELKPESEKSPGFRYECGQFNMVYLFGSGEAAISISGDRARTMKDETLFHTIRAVGSVTRGLSRLSKGDSIGIRGPFGTAWPLSQAEGKDVVLIAGGIGLAPLRPVIYEILSNRTKYGKLTVLYGARTPGDILFSKEIGEWRSRLDIEFELTVDRAAGDWRGNVGVVTALIPKGSFDPKNTIAMLCGPEIMMRFSVQALEGIGVASDRIFVSMERNMKCAVSQCGHCQMGPFFICKDGPVFPHPVVADWLRIREL